MNQLEVGKVYTTQAGEKIKIVSRRETADPSCEFLGQTVGKIHTTYYSLHGIARDEFSGLNIAWPVEFKPGQLVMVRDANDHTWQPRFYISTSEAKSFLCGRNGIVTSFFAQCRHPTDTEWLEFREGKR
jgi:hypothetical protein